MYLDRRASPKLQQGIGLPATIFLISILALIVVAMSELNEHSGLGFGQNLQSMRAFYAAESGAQSALNRVFVGGTACVDPVLDVDFDTSADASGLNQCAVQVACQVDVVDVGPAARSYYTFISSARCGSGFEQAQRTIQLRARSD